LATRIQVYNDVLFKLKTRRLASLTDDRPERKTLDEAWDGALDYMLEAGLWNFASRTEELQSSDSITPNFGYTYVFEKPEDYVRIIKISDIDTLTPTLDDFGEEGDYFLAWVDPLYLQYVSDGDDYGGDPGKWTASFTRALVLELAYRVAGHVTSAGEDAMKLLNQERERAIAYAKGKDVVNQPFVRLPPGRLTRSRAGYNSSHGRPPWRNW
jgi:hypothetical protein